MRYRSLTLRSQTGIRSNDSGSALAEFAIVSTALIVLILGIIDFGAALYTYHLVSNGARLGTRYAIVRGSSCTAAGCPATSAGIQTYVRAQAPGIDPNAMSVSATWPGNAGCSSVSAAYNGPGCVVAVRVQYPFRLIIPLMPSLTLNMTSTSQMVIAQ
jgi:Flp pilus assembly protein TadG